MPESVQSVVVLLTTEYSNRLILVGFAGGDVVDGAVTDEGAMVVGSGVEVTNVHCIETGDDLVLDEDYALFHTATPTDFVERFVPVLRMAIQRVGWPQVRASLRELPSASE